MKTKTKNSKSKNNRGLIEKIRYPAARNHPSLHSAYMFCPKNTGKNTKKNKKAKKESDTNMKLSELMNVISDQHLSVFRIQST